MQLLFEGKGGRRYSSVVPTQPAVADVGRQALQDCSDEVMSAAKDVNLRGRSTRTRTPQPGSRAVDPGVIFFETADR